MNETTRLPRNFTSVADEAWARMAAAPGFISEREGRFIALAAAATPATGAILEIGSFMGKSTVGLACVARAYAFPPVVAVDPFTAPSETDPDLGGEKSSFGAFERTVRSAGLEDFVEVHQARSTELAPAWNRPIRFLWIDGDHTYEGARSDLRAYRSWLAPGGVVAFHDALSPFAGPLRVFVEDVLSSDDFGPAGFVGSIAWAQFRPADGGSKRYRDGRALMTRKARRLLPLLVEPRRLHGARRMRFNLLRWLIPHAAVEPEQWAETVRIS